MEKIVKDSSLLFSKLNQWIDEAKKKYQQLNLVNYNAAALSTVSAKGCPSSRMVLIKEVNNQGLIFYTNLHSRKAQDIQHNNHVSILFHWEPLNRQVRIEGTAELATLEKSELYFSTRPYLSKIAAWASRQSEVMSSKAALVTRVAKYTLKFVTKVPKPEFWGGYLIIPSYFEFWQEGKFRMHHRVCYSKTKETSKESYIENILYP